VGKRPLHSYALGIFSAQICIFIERSDAMKKLIMGSDKIKRPFMLAVILFFVFGIAYAVEAKFLSGKELLEKINSSEKYDRDYALGYITGVYCACMETSVPDDQTMKKVVKVVKKYLRKNREKLNQSAVKLLKEAFDKAFLAKK
jgi:hypothetical protein